MPRRTESRSSPDSYEAGILVLFNEGWKLVERQKFADTGAALEWVKRRTDAAQQQHPGSRVSGCFVPLKTWKTLDHELAEHEEKRLAGDPDFCNDSLPAGVRPKSAPGLAPFSEQQGQVLSFIYYYTKVNGQTPVQRDIERYFKLSNLAAQQMLEGLEENNLVARARGARGSIRLLTSRERLPELE